MYQLPGKEVTAVMQEVILETATLLPVAQRLKTLALRKNPPQRRAIADQVTPVPDPAVPRDLQCQVHL